jgi:integrase
MRRGEVVGLKWSDLELATKRLSIQRTLQCVAGQPVGFGVKTRTSRLCIDLDQGTIRELQRWRRRLRRDGLPLRRWRLDVLQHHQPVPQPRVAQPALRPHREAVAGPGHPAPRLRHTHASPLIAAGVPIKVVSERLGHSTPGSR